MFCNTVDITKRNVLHMGERKGFIYLFFNKVKFLFYKVLKLLVNTILRNVKNLSKNTGMVMQLVMTLKEN